MLGVIWALGYFVLAQFENILWDRHLWFFLTLPLLAAPRTRVDEADPTVAGQLSG